MEVVTDVNPYLVETSCNSNNNFSFAQECVLEDPNVVDEVDNMMSSIGIGQVSAKATSALFSAKAWFTGKKRTDLFI